MEVRTCISKPHAIFIFNLARTSIERVSSDRRGRPQLDIQQLSPGPNRFQGTHSRRKIYSTTPDSVSPLQPLGGAVVRQNRVLLLNHGDEPVLVWAVRVQYCPDAAPPEASACSGYRILSFSPRSPLGEFGSPSTACCFETETFPSSACRYRQTFLGDIETVLVPVEACIDSRSAGYSCAMAPRRLQAVLDLAGAAPGARGAGSASAWTSASSSSAWSPRTRPGVRRAFMAN